MSNEFEVKYKALREKYKDLRKNHKRLAGVTLRLSEALETFLRGDGKPVYVSNVLKSCSEIYPGLVRDVEEDIVVEDIVAQPDEEEDAEAENPVGVGSEKEYVEGFWSNPKIPRTPQT